MAVSRRKELFPEVTDAQWNDWKWQVRNRIETLEKLKKYIKLSKEEELEIEMVGLCTDICVVSNALMLKAFMPEVKISVDSSCCAGVTVEKHEAALETMRSCQINVI